MVNRLGFPLPHLGKRRKSVGVIGLAVLIVGALALAGCGSSGSSSSSGASGASTSEESSGGSQTTASAGKAPSGTPLKIGVIAPLETQIENYPEIREDAKAAIDAINAEGGVNGQPLEMVFCNDQFNDSARSACLRQMSEEKVIGLTMFSCYAECKQTQDLGLPLFDFVSERADAELPNEFPITGGFVASSAAVPFALQKAGVKSLASAYIDLAPAKQKIDLMNEVAESIGIKVSTNVPEAPTTTDFSPFAQKISEAGVDGVQVVTATPNQIANVKELRSIGWEGVYGLPSGNIANQEAAEMGSLAEGLVQAATLPPPSATEYKGIQEYNEAEEAGGVPESAAGRPFGQLAFMSVYAMVEAAKTIKGEITTASMLEALESWPKGKVIDLKGLVKWDPSAEGPSYAPRAGNGNVWIETIKNGELVLESPNPIDVWKEIESR